MGAPSSEPPILVTGSHRSGSTWAGRIIAAAPRCAYLHEPFNTGIPIGTAGARFEHLFQYVCDTNAARYGPVVDALLAYRYPLVRNLGRVRSPRDAGKLLRDQTRFLCHRIARRRPVIKDPLALFAAEWLASRHGMGVVVMVRHPAAFCSSLKLKNWTFDFNHFARQPELLAGPLEPYAEVIRRYATNAPDLLDQGIVLWNCIHHVIRGYRKRHSDWQIVRHEDLSRDPETGFRKLFDALGLDYTAPVEAAVSASSGSHNPAEQGGVDEFARDSRSNIFNWKKRLKAAEIARIRDGCDAVSSAFYDESDW